MIGRLVSLAGSGNWEDLGLDMIEPDNLDKAKMLIATNVARKMACLLYTAMLLAMQDLLEIWKNPE